MNGIKGIASECVYNTNYSTNIKHNLQIIWIHVPNIIICRIFTSLKIHEEDLQFCVYWLTFSISNFKLKLYQYETAEPNKAQLNASK